MLNHQSFIFLLIVLLIPLFLFVSTADSLASPCICFISDRFGNDDLFLINQDGTNLTRLTTSEADEFNPVWSPNGNKILFLSKRGNFFNMDYDLWVINADGSDLTLVAQNIRTFGGEIPKWSPTGNKIVYVTDDKKRLKVFELTTKTTTDLLAPDTVGEFPDWSPDGNKIIAYLHNNSEPGIYLFNPDGSEQVRLIEQKGRYSKLAWAPDGSKFAFRYLKPALSFFGKESGLYVVEQTGKKGKFLGKGDEFTWCPDSQTIAFLVQHDNTSNDKNTYYSAYMVNAEINNIKNKPQKLNNTTNYQSAPFWSPDGRKIAYQKKNIVYLRESGSSKLIKIKVPRHYGTKLSWSPDSQKIIVVGYPKQFNNNTDLFIFNYQDGLIYNLTNTEKASEYTPVWAPAI